MLAQRLQSVSGAPDWPDESLLVVSVVALVLLWQPQFQLRLLLRVEQQPWRSVVLALQQPLLYSMLLSLLSHSSLPPQHEPLPLVVRQSHHSYFSDWR